MAFVRSFKKILKTYDIVLEKPDWKTIGIGPTAMETVAWLSGEKHTGIPSCSCPVITQYVSGIDSDLDHDDRQKIIPYLPRMIGTVSPEHESERARHIAWQTMTVALPIALKRVGLKEYANFLKRVGPDEWANLYTVIEGAKEAAAELVELLTIKRKEPLHRLRVNIQDTPEYKVMEATSRAWYACLHGYTKELGSVNNIHVTDCHDLTNISWAAHAAVKSDAKTALQILDGILKIGPSGDPDWVPDSIIYASNRYDELWPRQGKAA